MQSKITSSKKLIKIQAAMRRIKMNKQKFKTKNSDFFNSIKNFKKNYAKIRKYRLLHYK